LVQHIDALLHDLLEENHHLYVGWCHYPAQGSASPDFIRIAPIRSELSYAGALHEIGHIKQHWQASHYVVDDERRAWDWARCNALIWTPRMGAYAAGALASYEANFVPEKTWEKAWEGE
jgi:hypothetical protein